MRTKLLGLLAAVSLLAACETAPETAGSAAGSGQQASSSAGVTGTQTNRGPVRGSVEDLVANVGDRAFFGFDKYNLDAKAREQIEKWAIWLRQYPQVSVTIEGHADERGTREYNLALGERRASAAKDYLVALGIFSDRIKTLSYGEERPAALGSTDDAWAQNRRAVLTITGGAAS